MLTSQELNTHTTVVLNAVEPVLVALPAVVDTYEPFTDLVGRANDIMNAAIILRELGMTYQAQALVAMSLRLSLLAFVKAADVMTPEQDEALYVSCGSVMNDPAVQRSMAVINDEFGFQVA